MELLSCDNKDSKWLKYASLLYGRLYFKRCEFFKALKYLEEARTLENSGNDHTFKILLNISYGQFFTFLNDIIYKALFYFHVLTSHVSKASFRREFSKWILANSKCTPLWNFVVISEFGLASKISTHLTTYVQPVSISLANISSISAISWRTYD
jgi:hypothetical protein